MKTLEPPTPDDWLKEFAADVVGNIGMLQHFVVYDGNYGPHDCSDPAMMAAFEWLCTHHPHLTRNYDETKAPTEMWFAE